MPITKEQFLAIVLNKDLAGAFYQPLVDTSTKYDIDSPERLASFLSNVMHECNDLRSLSENLNYSASGLLKTFPKYFNEAQAEQYKRKPQAIANRVYANRYGNGDENSGDGWKYRGQGCIGLTFKDNYTSFSHDVGFDFVLHPDWLRLEKYAMMVAGWYWNKHNIKSISDQTEVRKAVNGGTNGLQDVINRYSKYLAILK